MVKTGNPDYKYKIKFYRKQEITIMVQEKIIEMLAEKLECETSEIAPDTTFAEMGIDSLDVAELVMNLEDEFGVSLEMDASLNTVAAVTAKIEELKAEV